jgi:hypothetical protein
MTAPDRFIAWCKQEQASIEQQLELIQSGKVKTGEDTGAGWIYRQLDAACQGAACRTQ